MILSQLQSPPKHSDPGKAAEALRAWLRWLQRADDVSVAKPDPSILARGLTAMTAEILHKNPESNVIGEVDPPGGHGADHDFGVGVASAFDFGDGGFADLAEEDSQGR